MRIMLAMQRADGIIGGWHGDGNFARTAIMYALWKQQGVTIQPWREDVRLGAVLEDNVLQLQLTTDQPWTGRLVFDPPRHRTICICRWIIPASTSSPSGSPSMQSAPTACRGGRSRHNPVPDATLGRLAGGCPTANEPLLITVQRIAVER